MSLATVPSMDQVAEQPELVMELPQPALRAMMIRAVKVQGACMAGLLGTAPPPAPPTPAPDKLVTAKEAATILGMSSLTLLRRRHQPPYRNFVVPTGTRSPRFSLHRIEQHIKQHAGTPARSARRDTRS